ncbi:hypothetical protein C1645_818950 [Glomus cerebriforme]|uniref:UvrD-like helicase C-terminal domain-containing protein n=1 Tax=Glomus cerebriforme TaxID=658196 RepID=A0A397TFW5_9GLOM|nr:hypothetical protein C1645_818950 [Glomus cerebriforme]
MLMLKERLKIVHSYLRNKSPYVGQVILSGFIGSRYKLQKQLPNKLFSQELCNGSIAYFNFNGAPARRTQFPLQNAFALTVHKTQGLTLPHATVLLDIQMFANGQEFFKGQF